MVGALECMPYVSDALQQKLATFWPAEAELMAHHTNLYSYNNPAHNSPTPSSFASMYAAEKKEAILKMSGNLQKKHFPLA